MILRRFIGGIVLGLLIGCGEQSPPATDVSVAKAPALPSDDQPKAAGAKRTEPYDATVGGFKFKVPADWIEQPPKSQFTLGEYSVPGDAGPGRLTLSSAGGGLDDNIERWKGQFMPGPNDPEPRTSEITFAGHQGTLVELNGTFSDMFSGTTPNRNWRMLGVAVSLGPTNYFVKLTGPASTLTDRRDEFIKFVESSQLDK